ncbi:MAG: tudor domain-containing protein [Myxococcaceae bacterium]
MRPAVVLALLCLTGCMRAPFSPADRVVGRSGSALRSGTVVKAQGKLVSVQWDGAPPEQSFVPAAWLVPEGVSPTAAAVGGWLVCPGPVGLGLCQVKQLGGTNLVVDTEEAEGVELDLSDTVPLPKALTGWAAKVGPRLLQHARAVARFDDAVPGTSGKGAPANTRALARWSDGNWWEATLGPAEGELTEVRWADGSAPSQLPAGDVAPMFGHVEEPGEGAVAFCRWSGSTRWWKAYVERVSGGSFQVAYEDGTKARLRPGDCVGARTR